MTQYPDLFAALAAPFHGHEVKTRQGGSGRTLEYITARTAMNRLDSVVGPENWHDDYIPLENSVLCKLTIRLPDGREVTKADAGGYAGMEMRDKATGQMVRDEENDEKTAFSDSFKRACVKFGIGRYLYGDGSPDFGQEFADTPHENQPPAPPRRDPAPAPARPAAPRPAEPRPAQGSNGGPRRQFSDSDAPRSGKALFAAIKKKEQDTGQPGILDRVNGWGKNNNLPFKMIDWPERAIADAWAMVLDMTQPVGAAAQAQGDSGFVDDGDDEELPF
jgi:hypothetical protein